jgi:hypothetical protein
VAEPYIAAGDPVPAVGPEGEELLMVYFGAPSMFITLWFGFDY